MKHDAPQDSSDFSMEADDLYREEIYTDRRVGTVRRLTPVDRSGADDARRPVIYLGQTQILTPVGALPVSFEIPAASLEEAIAAFGDGARQAAEQTIEELREMRREAASQIVIPDAGPGLGGLPGGGKIQF
ncbi:MAG: hypothetical protein RBT81_04505 [Gammaproteobacteria bacterium]|nr:hypothetical protein [Gammaproteobacteria bacterium]